MASFRFDLPVLLYLSWSAVGFLGASILNSFIEWIAHRFVLHSDRFVKFAYKVHDQQHHILFKADESYHAQNEEVKEHVTFVVRDYILFLLVTTPLWVAAELALGQPVLFGGIVATLLGLQAFNSLHWRFHVPSDTWFQRTRFFRYLKEHHRLHHADTRKNFNVYFLPLADFVMGTLLRQRAEPANASPTRRDEAPAQPAVLGRARSGPDSP